MDGFFPPDVRLRIEGDAPATAFALRGATRRLLFLALLLQERYADGRPVLLQQQIGPSSYAKVFLHQGQKIVTIYSFASPETPEPPTPELTPETITIPPPEISIYLGLLNGWWKDGTTTHTTSWNGTATITTALFRDYKPTPATALAQAIAGTLGPNERLHDTPAVPLGWAGGFTGSLKRVVQAIWALGEIDLPTIGYISGTTASPTKRTPSFSYPQGADQTVGLYKAGAQNHWLVEIGYRGVLAMPLILLEETKGAGYRDTANRAGDTDTVRVLDEFGGLPSGEGFPDDSNLAAAITAGQVLQLLTATNLAAPLALSPYAPTHDGWAFSESGAMADLVGYKYEAPGANWSDGEKITPAGQVGFKATRVMMGEHYTVRLALTTHNIANLTGTPPTPVGSGSAEVKQLTRGKVDPRALFDIWYGAAGPGNLSRVLPSFWRITTLGVPVGQVGEGTSDCELPTPPGFGNELANPCVNDKWGATVHVHYEGERLYRVRWMCYKQLALDMSLGSDYINVWSPKAFVGDGVPELRTPVGHAPNGGAGGTNRKWTFNDVILVLPAGTREGYVLLQNMDRYDEGGGGVPIDRVMEMNVVGRFNGIGQVSFSRSPLPVVPLSDDALFVTAWCDRSPYLTTNPPTFDSPRPAFFFVANAGPSKQFAAYNGLIVLTSTTSRQKYWTDGVPAELKDLDAHTIGWLGSV